MPALKFKDIQKMGKPEREKKIKELKMEMTKAQVSAAKAGSSKIKEIKKIIARILTLNSQEKNSVQATKLPTSSKQSKDSSTKVENKK